MKCPRCQQDNPVPDAQFCPRCGAPAEHAQRRATSAASYADVQRELAEAREQQAATSEILTVIRSSPSALQPVFDTIVRNAGVVCGSVDAILWTIDGNELVIRAHHGPLPATIGARQPISGSVAGYAVREARVVHVEDLTETDDFPVGRDLARRFGGRTTLSAPLLREGVAIGVILIRRSEVRPFTDKQIALLQTFADQAVIAIENVRLFTELQEKNRALAQAHIQMTETLEQQTATAEILGVISSSPTSLQPVLDAVAENAARVCKGQDASVILVEGASLRRVAHTRGIPVTVGDAYTLTRGTVMGRAVIDRRTTHVEDLLALPNEYPEGARLAAELGHRTTLATPLLREGEAIGALLIRRLDVRRFTDAQVTLLETFAAQAVIAIENVRLFTELEARNAALSEALEQQTATSEVLRVISQSTTEIEPVFDTIVKSAARLCDGVFATLFRFDGEMLHWVSQHNSTPEGLDAMRRRWPRPPGPETIVGRAVIERTVIHVRDSERDPDVPVETREIARAFGYRSVISVPMIREGQPVGGLSVARRDQPFSPAQISLLRTFADQAVIAVENVRLFNELQVANRGLKAASQHKSEFLANMSHELRTPLNAVIGFSEVMIDRMFGELNEKQDEYLRDIHASGQHLLSLINDILDLSKVEAGRMELELTDFHLPGAIDNALTLVRERAGRRDVALHHTVDERLGEIRGDERKIKQVMLNLLSNALKFTPEGGRVDVRADLVEGMAEISVADTGVGIAPEDQEAIFEEFRQVGTAAKKVEGTGLGLALSRKFVELHGGRIWVESQVGAGSTFTFAIPVRSNEESR
jgi:signal transduction histidine kinase